MNKPKVRIIVCGLCARDAIPLAEIFRCADSKRGQQEMKLHIWEAHGVRAK